MKRAAAIPAVLWKAINGLLVRNGLEISGYIAFNTMLSLFPFLIFLVSIAGFFGDTETGQNFISTLSLFAPPDVMKTLQPALTEVIQNRSGKLLTFGLLLAMYSAASGVEGLRTALNLAYGVDETRSFLRRKAEDFLIVLIGSIVALLSSVAIIFWPWIWGLIGWFAFVDNAEQQLWRLAHYGFTLLILALSVIGLHRILPNARLTIRQILPGALATTLAWIVAASALTVYFGRLSNYASTYGSLGGVIVTLLFFYVSGIVFIFGGELNGVLLARARKPAPPPNPELRSSSANV